MRSTPANGTDEPGRIRRSVAVLRSRWRTVALVVGLVVIVGTSLVAFYVLTPYGPDADRVAAVESNPDVELDRYDGGYVLRGGPVTDETVGLIVYPGARVEPESYAWTLAPLVEAYDLAIVVPEMPLNFAFFDPGAADDIVADHPEIDRWAIGGHSLGGAMACRYAAGNPDDVDGVLLYASYCDESDDLRGTDLPVLSIQGERDGVIDAERERDNRYLLGERGEVVVIDGMNHAQFGAYGDQRGDDSSTIDDETARERLVEKTSIWLEIDVEVVERSDADVRDDIQPVLSTTPQTEPVTPIGWSK